MEQGHLKNQSMQQNNVVKDRFALYQVQ